MNKELLHALCERLAEDCAEQVALQVLELNRRFQWPKVQQDAIQYAMTKVLCDAVVSTAELFVEVDQEATAGRTR